MENYNDEESWRVCPHCGSEYFLSTRLPQRVVFKITKEYSPRSVAPAAEDNSLLEVNSKQIFCGACSWCGTISEVTESHM